MNTGPFAMLIGEFAKNWRTNAPELAVSITNHKLNVEETHPLFGEFASLCSGRAASLPFFPNETMVIWCTVAPNSDSLRQVVCILNAWVMPSFGGVNLEDGYVQPTTAKEGLTSLIISVSPSGYFRWRCPRKKLPQVLEKLRLRRSLEDICPPRTRPPRPSLYEMRARFATNLLVGNRDGAEEIIQLLDSLQLETAVNTQFMRIRLWHHFREHDRIRTHPDLPNLMLQPLPSRVRTWINEALVVLKPNVSVEVPEPLRQALPPPTPLIHSTWVDWFEQLRCGERNAAEIFLAEHHPQSPDEIKPAELITLVTALEDLFVDDALRERERILITLGIAEFLEEFVREPEFPRAGLGDLYIALMRIWSVLHAGNSSGQQHGHVLLELASATLQLNRDPQEVLKMIEHWWNVRPSCSQLPFALDAIELLEREYPDPRAPANLWLATADLIRRNPEALILSEQILWRRTAKRLDIEDATVSEYLPLELEEHSTDLLAERQFKHIAIICMRERQADEAAKEIFKRTGAKITLVTRKAAGADTDLARTADVVLFVWMATSHAVFRALDGLDRKQLCYVQGTGAASIVRSLERWTMCES